MTFDPTNYARVEHDRLTCQEAAARGQEPIATWLAAHPDYGAAVVAQWLGAGYSPSNLRRLRRWGLIGCKGSPHAEGEKRNARRRETRGGLPPAAPTEEHEEEHEEEDVDRDSADFILTCVGQSEHRADLFLRDIDEVKLTDRHVKHLTKIVDRTIRKWERGRILLRSKSNGRKTA